MSATKTIHIGNVKIGGSNPLVIQSMTNTDTKNIKATVKQILELEQAGCQIIRCAIYDKECAELIPKIKEQIHIPLVADIHFDHKIAVAAVENGVDKIRINPGNIGGTFELLRVVNAAKVHKTPIRVGANGGSLPKHILEKYGTVTADALVESVLEEIRILEKNHFDDIIVSLKSSFAPLCVEAYRKISEIIDYPLHLGVTEAGTYKSALIKSSIALGSLILDNIGDTIRVSITGDPIQEIYAARDILKSCGIINEGVEIISCPTCARCTLPIEKICNCLEDYTRNMKKPMKVAVMGCAVNGPGEAKEADIGIAGGKGEGLLFKKGEIVRKIDEFDIIPELKRQIKLFQE